MLSQYFQMRAAAPARVVISASTGCPFASVHIVSRTPLIAGRAVCPSTPSAGRYFPTLRMSNPALSTPSGPVTAHAARASAPTPPASTAKSAAPPTSTCDRPGYSSMNLLRPPTMLFASSMTLPAAGSSRLPTLVLKSLKVPPSASQRFCRVPRDSPTRSFREACLSMLARALEKPSIPFFRKIAAGRPPSVSKSFFRMRSWSWGRNCLSFSSSCTMWLKPANWPAASKKFSLTFFEANRSRM